MCHSQAEQADHPCQRTTLYWYEFYVILNQLEMIQQVFTSIFSDHGDADFQILD